MNTKTLILNGLATALCLAFVGRLEARGIILQPPTPQSQPQVQPGIASSPGAPETNSNPAAPVWPNPNPTPPAAATDPLSPTNPPGPGDQTQVPAPVNRASHLIGLQVRNTQNQTLGRIKDVIIDLKNSRVPYLVLEKSSHSHGTGNELAIPLNHFAPSPDRKSLVLNADRDHVQNARGFSGDNLPAMNNPAFGAEPEQPTRREIFIIPVPVRPNDDENQDDGQHDAIPPHHSRQLPKLEKP